MCVAPAGRDTAQPEQRKVRCRELMTMTVVKCARASVCACVSGSPEGRRSIPVIANAEDDDVFCFTFCFTETDKPEQELLRASVCVMK